jgi:hypothetical protein
MLKEKIIDSQTGEISWRDYTDAEIAKVEVAKQEATERAKLQAEKEAARQAVLTKLGLTAEEAQVLLG